MAKAKRRKMGRKTAKRGGARKGKTKRRAAARKGARKSAAKRKTAARKTARKASARRKSTTAAKPSGTAAPSTTSSLTSSIPSLGGWRPFGSTGTDENK